MQVVDAVVLPQQDAINARCVNAVVNAVPVTVANTNNDAKQDEKAAAVDVTAASGTVTVNASLVDPTIMAAPCPYVYAAPDAKCLLPEWYANCGRQDLFRPSRQLLQNAP